METVLIGLGVVTLLSVAIKTMATAIRDSRLKEFSVIFRFETKEDCKKDGTIARSIFDK